MVESNNVNFLDNGKGWEGIVSLLLIFFYFIRVVSRLNKISVLGC